MFCGFVSGSVIINVISWTRMLNPLRTVAAYMRHGNNNITVCKQIAVNSTAIHPIILKPQPFCLLCSGDYFNILGRVLKPTRRFKITSKGSKK